MKKSYIGIVIVAALLLGGCAHENLKTPCPNFGASCSQKNINSWN